MKHPPPVEILFQPLSHVKGRETNTGPGSGVLHGSGTRVGIGCLCVELSFDDMPADSEVIFFDGECGLCHRAVRFVLRHDRKGHFRFAPLQGETFLSQVPEGVRSRLPETLVVLSGDGRFLLRSEGALHVLENLGGVWRALGRVLAWLPRRYRDSLYDAVATRRARLFSRPSQGCPVVQPEQRRRFDP